MINCVNLQPILLYCFYDLYNFYRLRKFQIHILQLQVSLLFEIYLFESGLLR